MEELFVQRMMSATSSDEDSTHTETLNHESLKTPTQTTEMFSFLRMFCLACFGTFHVWCVSFLSIEVEAVILTHSRKCFYQSHQCVRCDTPMRNWLMLSMLFRARPA